MHRVQSVVAGGYSCAGNMLYQHGVGRSRGQACEDGRIASTRSAGRQGWACRLKLPYAWQVRPGGCRTCNGACGCLSSAQSSDSLQGRRQEGTAVKCAQGTRKRHLSCEVRAGSGQGVNVRESKSGQPKAGGAVAKLCELHSV